MPKLRSKEIDRQKKNSLSQADRDREAIRLEQFKKNSLVKRARYLKKLKVMNVNPYNQGKIYDYPIIRNCLLKGGERSFKQRLYHNKGIQTGIKRFRQYFLERKKE